MNNNSLLRQVMLAFYLFLFTLVSGCGSSSHSDPARYNLQFQAHPQINRSAPLKVRVLVLKSDAEFMSADFYSLQNNAQKVLAGNLLNSDEFFLMPGQLAKKLSGQSSPEARYIGVMAEYQSLDGKKWRISLPLP
ncbi:type VI secretion system lipoprotein TssJ, partial [Klebsiella aerogenes]|nr:type VI secretion system lipoprotein TssJ [Klebsiella aerogenes]